jgi:hypothetical protein
VKIGDQIRYRSVRNSLPEIGTLVSDHKSNISIERPYGFTSPSLAARNKGRDETWVKYRWESKV